MIDGTLGGALLLELFQRDGIGTMVARYGFSPPIVLWFSKLQNLATYQFNNSFARREFYYKYWLCEILTCYSYLNSDQEMGKVAL